MKTFDDLMQEMLGAVPDDLDKREGSVIYTAVAPVAAQLAELYVFGENLINAAMPDTGRGDDLTRTCKIYGVNRYPASFSVREGIFTDRKNLPMIPAIGSRFSDGKLGYIVIKADSAEDVRLQCETLGSTGNRYFGVLIPVYHVPELGTATLGKVLVPGEEEETDEELRRRFYAAAMSEPFGGNVAQYEGWLLGISGIGFVKIFPTPDGTGGKVQCVIVTPDKRPVSNAFLQSVQEQIDPSPSGKGLGLAPIGHTVTISTVTETAIRVTSSISLKSGATIESVQGIAEAAISTYFSEIAFSDPVVRISRIDAALVQLPGVADIQNTKLNGSAGNLVLPDLYNDYQIPMLQSLTFTEVNG